MVLASLSSFGQLPRSTINSMGGTNYNQSRGGGSVPRGQTDESEYSGERATKKGRSHDAKKKPPKGPKLTRTISQSKKGVYA